MLQPIRTKYRKAHKGRIHGKAKGGTELNFGSFGLKAVEPDRVTARQIEAARRAISRGMKRAGRLWIRVFPDVPVTKKPTEVRMGSGKGLAGAVDRPREARPHHVRAGRGHGGDSPRGAAAGRRQAADQDPHREAAGVEDSGTMKPQDVRAMSADQLDEQVAKLKKEQFNLRFQRATGQLENTARVRAARRDVARVKTVQNQRRRGETTGKA